MKNKTNTARLIFIVLLLWIVAALFNPKLLFFLQPEQQAVIAGFQETYFVSPFANAEGVSFDFGRVIAVILIACEVYVAQLAVNFLASKTKLKNRRNQTFKDLIFNFVKYGVTIYGIIFALSICGVNMVAVFTSLGILGLVIGFGTQTLIQDVITGLFIIFEGQFNVGDIISVDGFRGTVSHVGIRTTCITDSGGNIKIVNNSDIRNVVNLSEEASYAVADISITYAHDIEEAENILIASLPDIMSKYPSVFPNVPTYSGVQNLGASSVDLRVVALVDEANVFRARRLLNRELKITFDKNNIDIPFPQLTVWQADSKNQ